RVLVQLAAGQLPRAEAVGLDYRVLAFTAAISLLTGIAFGLVPAVRASSPELQQSLREGTRGSTGGSGGLRNTLVVAEVALAMVLPSLAGRDLSPQDRQGAPIALVINQALAKKYFPGRSPIGQTITFGDTNHLAIVGVVGDVRQSSVDETPTPRIYASAYQIF